MTTLDSEWDQRVLCSDGSCIGVVGADGRCKECGRPFEGALPPVGQAQPAAVEEPDEREQAPASASLDALDNAPADEGDRRVADDDWEARTLCIDGSCIGVVRNDGRCGTCGKPHPDKAS